MQALREVRDDDRIRDKMGAYRMMLRMFDRWMDAEVNTATARARTAKQFEEFLQPDNLRLFPNLRWIASRSADPRASHTKFYDRVWAKTDPFWQTNAPGTEWNYKCDIEETDDPVTDNSGVPHHIPPRGLEGNPAETGQLFTENASYVRGTKGVPEIEIIRTARDTFQARNKGAEIVTDTNLGRIVADDISIVEASKGSATEQNLFMKQEIVLNISRYVDKLEFLRDEAIDLSHNNKKGLFFKKKRQFSVMKVYRLLLESKNYQGKLVQMDFIVKMGKFKSSGDFHLYSITG